MISNRTTWSRPIPLVVFTALAALIAFVVSAQSPQQPAAPQTTQRGNAAPAPQYQNQNQNTPAAAQPTAQANRDARATENGRQAARADQSRSDSRQRQGGQSEEQDSAWLGVYLSDRDSDRGATVAHVYPSGPAARAGLYPGDVIQQINGQQVSSGNDLVTSLEQMKPGDKIELSVLRNNEPTKVTATLGSRDSFIFRGQN